jgi:hypothetical protein
MRPAPLQAWTFSLVIGTLTVRWLCERKCSTRAVSTGVNSTELGLSCASSWACGREVPPFASAAVASSSESKTGTTRERPTLSKMSRQKVEGREITSLPPFCESCLLALITAPSAVELMKRTRRRLRTALWIPDLPSWSISNCSAGT